MCSTGLVWSVFGAVFLPRVVPRAIQPCAPRGPAPAAWGQWVGTSPPPQRPLSPVFLLWLEGSLDIFIPSEWPDKEPSLGTQKMTQNGKWGPLAGALGPAVLSSSGGGNPLWYPRCGDTWDPRTLLSHQESGKELPWSDGAPRGCGASRQPPWCLNGTSHQLSGGPKAHCAPRAGTESPTSDPVP